MAKFTRLQLEGMDLNLFFRINGVPVHIATFGTSIPQNLNDCNRIAENWMSVKSLPYSTQFQLNGAYLEQTATNAGYEYLLDERSGYMHDIHNTFPSMDAFDKNVPLPVKLYSWSFVDMARRGFYSFAPREGITEQDGRIRFILISRPIEPLQHRIDNLPEFQIPNFYIENNEIETEGIFFFEIIK